MFVAAVFLLLFFFWLAALHQLKSLAPIVYDATNRTRTLVLAAFILPPLAAAWSYTFEQLLVNCLRYLGRVRLIDIKQDREVMTRARTIIALLGTTNSLLREMGQIRQLGFAEKTLFVMPPLVMRKKYRARWEQFADLVCGASEEDGRRLEKVNPRRVLAAVEEDCVQ